MTPREYLPATMSYTPGTYYLQSWADVKGSETGPEESYADAVTEILFECDGLGVGYAGMLKTRLPKGLTPERAEEIRDRMAFQYLDSYDYLPAFPTAADWAENIGAPEEYAAALLQHGSSVLNHLPTLEDGTLPAFFERAVEKLRAKMRPLNELPDFEERMEQTRVWKLFTALAIGNQSALHGLPHPQLLVMIAEAVKEFAPRLQAYRLALVNKNQGAFDKLLDEVKQQGLNKEDAVAFLVNHFLA